MTVQQVSPEGVDKGFEAASPLLDASLAGVPPTNSVAMFGGDVGFIGIASPADVPYGTLDRNGIPLPSGPWANEVPPTVSTAEVLPVPEPSSLLLLATALCSLGLLAHRSNRRRKSSASAPCGNQLAAG